MKCFKSMIYREIPFTLTKNSRLRVSRKPTTIVFLFRRSTRGASILLSCRPRELLFITFLWAFHVAPIIIRGIDTAWDF